MKQLKTDGKEISQSNYIFIILGSVIDKEEEIKKDAIHRLSAGWMKSEEVLKCYVIHYNH